MHVEPNITYLLAIGRTNESAHKSQIDIRTTSNSYTALLLVHTTAKSPWSVKQARSAVISRQHTDSIWVVIGMQWPHTQHATLLRLMFSSSKSKDAPLSESHNNGELNPGLNVSDGVGPGLAHWVKSVWLRALSASQTVDDFLTARLKLNSMLNQFATLTMI